MYIPGGPQSMDRFVRGAYHLKHLPAPKSPEEAITYGFSTVQLMTKSPGSDFGFTQWTIVSDHPWFHPPLREALRAKARYTPLLLTFRRFEQLPKVFLFKT